MIRKVASSPSLQKRLREGKSPGQGTFCTSGNIWQRLETFLFVTTGWGRGVATGNQRMMETRDAAPCPATHRTVPTAKRYPAPNVSGAWGEPCPSPRSPSDQSRGPAYSPRSLQPSRQDPHCGSQAIKVSCPRKWGHCRWAPRKYLTEPPRVST